MTINQTASIGRSRITRQLYRFALAGAIIILAADALAAQPASYAVIYDFQGTPDGGHPTAAVTYGKGGALYGTADQGGQYGQGAAFELAPGAAKTWTETVLHSFGAGSDGSRPWANLVPQQRGGALRHHGSGWDQRHGNGVPTGATPSVRQSLGLLSYLQLWVS
jgi:uncharacterized repeat protein (TIGR03803 family)